MTAAARSILTVLLAVPVSAALAQADMAPVNDLPNPYQIYTAGRTCPPGANGRNQRH